MTPTRVDTSLSTTPTTTARRAQDPVAAAITACSRALEGLEPREANLILELLGARLDRKRERTTQTEKPPIG